MHVCALRKTERKLSSMIKLSVVKVFPCVLMFAVKRQLRGMEKGQEKIELHLSVSRTIMLSKCLFISSLPTVKPSSLLLDALMLFSQVGNILTLVTSLRKSGISRELVNIWRLSESASTRPKSFFGTLTTPKLYIWLAWSPKISCCCCDSS